MSTEAGLPASSRPEAGRRHAPPRALVVAVVLACMVVALAAATTGPVRYDPHSPLQRLRSLALRPSTTATTASADTTAPSAQQRRPVVTVPVDVVGVLLTGALLALVVRLLMRHRVGVSATSRHGRGQPARPAGVAPSGLADSLAAAAASAAVAMQGRRASKDAVIACWLELEAAALTAGTPRDAAQTPSEFTAAVLAEQHASPQAVATLLRLYHRARFSAAAMPDHAGADAAEALARVAADLQPDRGHQVESAAPAAAARPSGGPS